MHSQARLPSHPTISWHGQMNDRARLVGYAPKFGSGSVAEDGARPRVQHSCPEHCRTTRVTRRTGIDPGLKAPPAAPPQPGGDALHAHASLLELSTRDDAGLTFGELA